MFGCFFLSLALSVRVFLILVGKIVVSTAGNWQRGCQAVLMDVTDTLHVYRH